MQFSESCFLRESHRMTILGSLMFYDSEYFSEGPGYFPGACGVLRVCW